MGLKTDSDIQYLKGVGPKRARQLARMGIDRVEDLLFHFPHRYEDRTNLKKIASLSEGSVETVRAEIVAAKTIKGRFRKRMFQVTAKDETGLMSCLWFSAKGDYLSKKYQPGMKILATGRVGFSGYQNCFEMPHPDIVVLDEEDEHSSGGIIPVYPLTEGLNQKILRKIAQSALANAPKIEEIIPKKILKKHRFPERDSAIRAIHSPGEKEEPELFNEFKSPSHRRMAFEEFFILECAMALRKKRNTEKAKGIRLEVKKEIVEKIVSPFPFELTGDQRQVLNEIARDIKGEHPMNRLLQGDVGCGKTAVAFIAMQIAVAQNYQAALMAPTEILAEQHYKNLKKLKTELPIKPALLVSGLKAKEKERIKEEAAAGKINILIGTHALIQQTVEMKNLAMAVIDEQHRFGVKQRAELISKGPRPHTLIMTATPIPRTLAMTVYSDLDVSIIKEMPKNRGEVETKVIKPSEKQKTHILIHREIKKGRQAYIVYPLVEESEKVDLKAATEMHEHYQKNVFPDLRLGLVHGRMKADEKNEVMHSFMKGEIDILVSTTVVEVGIDQPNATVMMVEHAERFGLAQLHQLRGRVGRGADKSYCLLAIEYPISEVARERLKVMSKTTDGFIIAEKDLELRGTGDLFGTKQSGLPTFRIANLLRDFDLLKLAKDEAFALIAEDPDLVKAENQPLREELKKSWQERFNLFDIG